jgi:hypothetical protein
MAYTAYENSTAAAADTYRSCLHQRKAATQQHHISKTSTLDPLSLRFFQEYYIYKHYYTAHSPLYNVQDITINSGLKSNGD